MKGGDPIVRLDHLLAAVAEIRLFTAGKDHAAFEAVDDRDVWQVVQHDLGPLGDAVRSMRAGIEE